MVIALDLSNSMEAKDLLPNRLEAAKRVVDDFISRRRSDKIGLVVFGKEAFTHCPLTLDYSVLRTMLGEMQLGLIDGAATAIGNAIGESLARMRKSDAKSRVIILLTDGKPYDSDTYQDNTYAQEDTKIALREARREKIHLFCVTVDSEAADYLPHMYSDANFVIIDDVRTLPQKLPQLYRRLTT